MDGMRYRFLNNSFVIIFVFKVLTAKTPLFLFEDFFLTIEVKWFGLPLRRDAKFCVSTPWENRCIPRGWQCFAFQHFRQYVIISIYLFGVLWGLVKNSGYISGCEDTKIIGS